MFDKLCSAMLATCAIAFATLMILLVTTDRAYAHGGRVVQRQRIVTRTPLIQRQRVVVRQQVVASPIVAPLVVQQPVQAFVAQPLLVQPFAAGPQVQFFSSSTTGCAAFFAR